MNKPNNKSAKLPIIQVFQILPERDGWQGWFNESGKFIFYPKKIPVNNGNVQDWIKNAPVWG